MLQPDSSEVDNVAVEQGRKNSSGSVAPAVRSDAEELADSSYGFILIFKFLRARSCSVSAGNIATKT